MNDMERIQNCKNYLQKLNSVKQYNSLTDYEMQLYLDSIAFKENRAMLYNPLAEKLVYLAKYNNYDWNENNKRWEKGIVKQ